MIENGEALVRTLGFRVFRVRHIQTEESVRARVQIAPDEMGRLAEFESAIRLGLQSAGYASVEFDPAGYRSPQK
jgi:PP-loop superfamily ATP-utilizing enzyme